ncbi:MAG: HlyD family efflux transporter periplasmic adaptor subunit [Acidobacteriota bacterium]
MDLAKPTQPRRFPSWTQLSLLLVIAVVVATFVGLPRLRAGLPELDGDAAWFGTVERGPMTISVRAPGRLVPEQERWITAPAEGVVERMVAEPGDALLGPELLLLLANPELEREVDDAELALRSERAAAAALEARLANELLDLRASLHSITTDLREAELRSVRNESLHAAGLIAELELELGRLEVEELQGRRELENERLAVRRRSQKTEQEAQRIRIEQAETVLADLRRDVAGLQVRASVAGVVTEIVPEVGSRVRLGDPLIKVMDPSRLRVELDVPQARAADIVVGQTVLIDTRQAMSRGRVRRIDPSVQDGIVRVDVDPTEDLTSDARAAMRVDGTIEIEELGEVLRTRRPRDARENGRMVVYRLDESGQEAERVDVRLGRLSLRDVQVLAGLAVGDRIILSDTSQFGGADRIRIR